MTTVNESTAASYAASTQAIEVGRQLAGKYMTFKLADEEYGLEILNVREIIRVMEITRVPRTRDYIRGIINLRGKVVPVFDLRRKLGMPGCESNDQAVIIVVQVEAAGRALTMGVLVDEVLEVLSIDAAHIEPPPAFGAAALDTTFILGVSKAEKRVIFLVDIGKVLTAEDAGALVQAAA